MLYDQSEIFQKQKEIVTPIIRISLASLLLSVPPLFEMFEQHL